MFENAFRHVDDILHKDAGCSTELDYVEQSSWILFLKYLDDFETERAESAALTGKPYKPIIDEKYRWRSWAAPKAPDGKIDLATYAQEVGFEGELFFALQTVSNQANDVMVGCSPSLVTTNGETVEFENAFIFVGNLQDLVPEGDVEMYNQGVTLYNSLLGTDVLPGATVSSVFVAAGEVAVNGSIFSGAYTMETLLQGCDTKLVSK